MIFIKQCDIRNKTKTHRQNLDYLLVITEIPCKPFEYITMNILNLSRNNLLLTIMDNFSKFGQVYPVPNQQAHSIINSLLIYIQHFPVPKRIHTDAGLEFGNQTLRELAILYQFKLTHP